LVAQAEVIVRRERRRRWSEKERRDLLAEAFAPGAVVARVARQYEVAESCLYAWRKQYADDARDRPRLMPVMIADTSATVPTRDATPPSAAAVVTMPEGTRVEIAGGYPRATLRALIAALRRAP